MSSGKHSSSFRDPSGFLLFCEGVLYRQVNESYKEHYDCLKDSGLYEALTAAGLLLEHEEVEVEPHAPGHYKIIQPQFLPFISYPYEWSFSQLKDAALATLAIQKMAFEHGMTLKDSSAYNIQFVNGRPVLIDSLSLEIYREGQAWIPYKQYCQHFLAPLALMAKCDIRWQQLLRVYVDGIPLGWAAKQLPARSKLSFGLLTHLHLHARAQKSYASTTVPKTRTIGRSAFQGLVDSLETTTRKLTWSPRGTEWAEYYASTNYSDEAEKQKETAFLHLLRKVEPKTVLDLGANTGRYSQLAAEQGCQVLSCDIDPACVEKNYLQCRSQQHTSVLPLLLDVCNPSPGIGWDNKERMPFLERVQADVVVMLAQIHHLAISNNLPLSQIAEVASRLSEYLILEFVPKQDSQVQRLLSTRDDIFPGYSEAGFETEFSTCYEILDRLPLQGAHRTLYLLQRR